MLALSNAGWRAGQPGRGGAAAGRGGERQGPLRVDQHELGLAHGGAGGAAAAAGLERTSRGLGAGRQDNGAGGRARRVAGGGPEAVAGVALGDDLAREGGAGIEPRNPTPEALRTEAATVAAIREALATSPPGLRRVKQGIKASYYKTDRSNSGACLGGYRKGAVRVCENRHLRRLNFREWDLAEARLPRRTLLGNRVNSPVSYATRSPSFSCRRQGDTTGPGPVRPGTGRGTRSAPPASRREPARRASGRRRE